MAASPDRKTGFHAGSRSFPSRPNPVITQLDEHLCRSRASEGASTSSSSLGGKLSSLQDLHDCVNKLLLLPLNQQAIAQANSGKLIDELLDGSLEVLDVCNTAKDALLQTKESVHELQSILRRRCCGETGLSNEVKKYITSRKVVKRTVHKALKVIKKNCTFSTFNGVHETTSMFSMLKEILVVSLQVLESLHSFISGPKAKTTGWSLVSKLVHHKKVAPGDEEADINEFAKADAALLALVDQNTSKFDNIKTQLENLELCVQDIEGGLEYPSRNLIKTRVSFSKHPTALT